MQEDSGDIFEKVILYDNPFSNVLAELAFTGYGSSLRSSLFSSPEFTAVLEEYIETLAPSVYDDFLGTAKSILTLELREKLRHLLSFRFKKHPRHNLPAKRLRMIEKQVQKRARVLLDM